MPGTGEEQAVAFVARLRAGGLTVPVGATVAYTRALAELDGTPNRLYWAGRATLVTSPEQVPAYDAAFDEFWRGGPAHGASPTLAVPVTVVTDDADEADEGLDPADAPAGRTLTLRATAHESLRGKDFAAYDDDELAEARRLMADLRLVAAGRRSRRTRPSTRRRGPLDLRGTVRASLRTGGEVVRSRHTERRDTPRRLVLLLDVSGSMEPYSRALLRFAHAAVAGRTRVEAFTLGTRLTRLTRELATRDPDQALDRAAAAVPDWSGGTRLGEGLRRFNDTWGVRGLARGAVVVLLSDGWDRGEPGELAEQMARLTRVAHRVVWVNPLKATPGYEPLTRGMAAALPHVDDFVAGHSLDALEQLAATLAGTAAASGRPAPGGGHAGPVHTTFTPGGGGPAAPGAPWSPATAPDRGVPEERR